VLQRTHQCDRCEAAIEPGDVYGAIDGVDADGSVRVLLCRRCSKAFRRFLDGDEVTTPDASERRDDAERVTSHDADGPRHGSDQE
jgi:ribosomal protein L24E